MGVRLGRLPATAFRQSKAFEVRPRCPLLSAWLRYGELAVREAEYPDFSKQAFEAALDEARLLTIEPPEVFQPRLVELCRDAGVALVFTPDLPKTRVSAAVRWLTPRRPLIQLGLRYKTDDHLWFSFFHESVHVLRHGKKMVFLETNGMPDDAEREADRVAGDVLIPPREYAQFCKGTPQYSKAAIVTFARHIGIAPGIVVGRLQHDNLIPFTHCNGLKQHFEWSEAAAS